MREHLLSSPAAYVRWIDLAGELPARVYVHGLGSSAASDWPHIATHPALTGHRSLLVDLLGYGYSDRPRDFSYSMEAQAAVLAELLDAEGLSAVELLGHSMGGAVAIALAAARPDLVSRLVVSEPNLFPGGGFASSPVAAQDEAAFVEHGYAEYLAAARGSVYAASVRIADPIALHRSATAMVAGTDPAWGDLLARFKGPRAFLVGTRNLPYPEADLMATAGVPVIEVPDSGHSMSDDNPDGYARAIAEAFRVT